LIAASPAESKRMVRALKENGVGAWIIGQVLEGPAGVQAVEDRGQTPLPTFARDELAHLFEERGDSSGRPGDLT